MTSFFRERSGIGVHQKRKLFELRNQYTLTDEVGEPAGRVEQSRQSRIEWLAGLMPDLDTVVPKHFEVSDAAGSAVLALALYKRSFTWRVAVTDPRGRTLGVIGRRIRIGKAMYSITDAAGHEVGLVRAEDWRSRNFQVVDAAGRETGRVTKYRRGFKEAVPDANSFLVTFTAEATDDQRALVFGGGLAVDLIQKAPSGTGDGD